MPYVPWVTPDTPPSPVRVFALVVAVAIIVAAAAAIVRHRAKKLPDPERSTRIREGAYGVLAIAVTVGVMAVAFTPGATAVADADASEAHDRAERQWRTGWAKEARTVYAVELDADTFEDLRFPTEMPEEPATFGSAWMNADGTGAGKVRIHLVFNGDTFQLLTSTVDGLWAELPTA